MKKLISTLMAMTMIFGTSAIAFAAATPDEERPGIVKNLVVTPLDGGAKATWDPATDNVGVKGYQLHYGETPVAAKGEAYDNIVDVKNVLEYTLDGLTNDTTYYFSVVAYDEVGNESAKWAKEASITPSSDAGDTDDTESPQVADAEAINKEEVKVTFSEAVVLPAEDPEDAFTIEIDDTLEPFAVLDAKMDEEDDTGSTVILTTAVQEEGTDYKLTVGIDIEDKSGNSMISGTSDTAIFTGTAVEKEAENLDGPQVVKAESTGNTKVLVNFNEKIVLSIDPSENFEVMEEESSESTLQILGVELVKNTDGIDDAAAIVTTSPQDEKAYVVVAKKLKDEDGNSLDPTKSSATFDGTAGAAVPDPDGDGETETDIVPPSDVAKFLANVVLDGEKYMVTLSWEIPSVNVGDVVDQIVYMSTDKGGNYLKQATLDAEATKYEMANLEAGEYWFKLTQRDAEGNESDGVLKKVVLSETGPGVVGLILFSLAGGRLVGRKRKK